LNQPRAAVLLFPHLVGNRVRDPAAEVGRDLGAVRFGEVALDIADRDAAGAFNRQPAPSGNLFVGSWGRALAVALMPAGKTAVFFSAGAPPPALAAYFCRL